MAVQALYRKWRSRTFDQVVGQEHAMRTLRNALRDGRIAHAYLFAGPRGTGKTSTARILAKAVNCLNDSPAARPDDTCPICESITDGSLLDLIEIDAASNRGIDEIRDLREKVHFSPSQARFKVYVIDESHMLTPEAFNALLKTLEEPPPHVIFVLATTEPHKIPDTVLSRCQRLDFRRIPAPEIAGHLAFILEHEGRSAEPAALHMIARSAEGSMRDAISLLDQLMSYGDHSITEAQVRAVRGTISGEAIAGLVGHLVEGEVPGGMGLINLMAADGVDLRQLALQLVEHLRWVLLAGVSGLQAEDLLADLTADQLQVVQEQARRWPAAEVSRAIRLFNQAALDMRDSFHPQLCLELAWLDANGPVGVAEPVVAVRPTPAPRPAMAIGAPEPVAAVGAETSPAGPDPAPPVEEEVLPAAGAPVPDDEVVVALRAHWAALLQAAEARRGGSLRGALRTLRHVVSDGGDLYFAFEREFAKTVVERPANRAALQEILSQLLGRPIRLHCQVGTKVSGVSPSRAEPVPAPPPATPQAGQDLMDDPVVEHARRHLGAVSKDMAS